MRAKVLAAAVVAILAGCYSKTNGPIPCAASPPMGDVFSVMVERYAGVTPDPLTSRLPKRMVNAPQWRAQHRGPASVACWAGRLAGRADQAVASKRPLSALFMDAARSIGYPIELRHHARPIDPEQPLLAALDALHGNSAWPGRDTASSVPIGTQRAAARILVELSDIARIHRAGLRALMDEADRTAVFANDDIDPQDPRYARLYTGGKTGYRLLYSAAARLLAAIDDANLDAAAASDTFEFYSETPLGGVLLRGGADDTYDPETDPRLSRIVLAIDTGGNDTVMYAAGATQSADNPIAMHIDLGGKDNYGYKAIASTHDVAGLMPSDAAGRAASALPSGPGPESLSTAARQGAGILGYGVLVDLGGSDDRYRSLRHSQGFARFGVGVLYDDGGNEVYEAESDAQAAAYSGIALLVDAGGNDRYHAFNSAQAYAFLESASVLYDGAGDDQYNLVQGPPILKHWGSSTSNNLSLGQGAAFGWRRRMNKSLPGGIALLRERAGNDRYVGSTFVQGSGYWLAAGVLADAAGNDAYNARHYAQGAGAHFALGVLLEGAGDDVYNDPAHGLPILWSSLGHGHDFSAGYFVDDAGDDVYYVPAHGAGAGKCRGAGYFVEGSGNDRYVAETHVAGLGVKLLHLALGSASSFDKRPGDCGTRGDLSTYGFFADLDGFDDYALVGGPDHKNGASWSAQHVGEPGPVSGGGIDVTEGRTAVRAYGKPHTQLKQSR